MASPLPLFPLARVLVPGLVLPLHVFERRYRVLVQALMTLPDGVPRLFGVIAVRSGPEVGDAGGQTLYEVGCAAELREVTPLSDGRFDIVSVGQTRFRLLGLDPHAGTTYQTGRVQFLGEPDGAGDVEALSRSVGARFAAYRRQLGIRQDEPPTDARMMSYLVAAAMVLDLPDRQRLLEEPTTASRLRAEVDLLRRESRMMQAFRALPAVRLHNGEVNPN